MEIDVKTKIKMRNERELKSIVDDANFKNLAHGAAVIRLAAVHSIKYTREVVGHFRQQTKDGKTVLIKIYRPSPEGEPVHSHRSPGFARAAIGFSTDDRSNPVIGFTASKVGSALEPHEHGGIFRGQKFEPRPVMQPALESQLDRFAREWDGSIGE